MPRTSKNQNSKQISQEKSLTDIVYPESTGIPVPEYLGTPDKLPGNTDEAPQPKRRGRKPGPKNKVHKDIVENAPQDIQLDFQEKSEPVDGIAAAEKRLAEQYGVANIDAIPEAIFTSEPTYTIKPDLEASFASENNGEAILQAGDAGSQVAESVAPYNIQEGQSDVQAEPNAQQQGDNAQAQGDAQAQNGEGQDDRKFNNQNGKFNIFFRIRCDQAV